MPDYQDEKIAMWRALMQGYTPSKKRIGEIAMALLWRIRRRDARYEEECREYAKQGYRPHYCPHGTDLWVDWDPICQWCEESLTQREEALMLARDIDMEVYDRSCIYSMFIDQAADDRSEAADNLRYVYATWVLEPREQVLRPWFKWKDEERARRRLP